MIGRKGASDLLRSLLGLGTSNYIDYVLPAATDFIRRTKNDESITAFFDAMRRVVGYKSQSFAILCAPCCTTTLFVQAVLHYTGGSATCVYKDIMSHTVLAMVVTGCREGSIYDLNDLIHASSKISFLSLCVIGILRRSECDFIKELDILKEQHGYKVVPGYGNSLKE